MDRTIPPRMLIKVDIEKAYDTLNWDTILATMVKMHFPSNWVSYIKAYLNSTSFSLLINGSYWLVLSFKRGQTRWHLSSYVFILVAQNLIALFNLTKQLDPIHGFDCNLRYNFNHLIMYVDDLIIVTTTSRKSTRNVNLLFKSLSSVDWSEGQSAKIWDLLPQLV